eukprot:m.447217 g.447217  ORF g.447217 m.447217 type:complete len:376 (+) comp21501_c0_seq2:376-1503(+)
MDSDSLSVAHVAILPEGCDNTEFPTSRTLSDGTALHSAEFAEDDGGDGSPKITLERVHDCEDDSLATDAARELLLDEDQEEDSKQGKRCSATVVLWATVGVALVACLILALKPGLITPVLLQILNWVKSLGFWGPIALTAIILFSIPLCIPTTLFNVGGGFLFGWTFLPFLSFAATTGATIAYFLSRGFLKDVAERKLKKNKFFQSIRQIFVADDGKFTWRSTKAVLLTRASPFFPFVIINFANGVTGVSWKSYVLATWLGTLPWVSVDIYFGTLLEDLASVGNQHKSGLFLILLVIFTVLITVVITIVTKRELKRMEQALRSQSPSGASTHLAGDIEMREMDSGIDRAEESGNDDISDADSFDSVDHLLGATSA